MSFAKITVTGRVESDPEKRFTSNDHAVAQFTLAVDQPTTRQNQAEELNAPFQVQVVCWRGLAEAVGSSLSKGDYVSVDGKLMINSFQTSEGVQKKSFEIEAAGIDKLPGATEPIVAVGGNAGAGQWNQGGSGQAAYSGGRSGAQGQAQQAEFKQPQVPAGGFSSEELLTEDDIPF